jgi:hypothetical protein
VTPPTTRAEFDDWQFEQRLVEDLLVRVEQAERAILTALRCPHDLPTIYAILNRERKEPWPRRMARRDQRRARYAFHALAHVAETRRYLALGVENPRLAARAALLAGLFANVPHSMRHSPHASLASRNGRPGTRAAPRSPKMRRQTMPPSKSTGAAGWQATNCKTSIALSPRIFRRRPACRVERSNDG